jgi:hypothetical protein
MRRHTCRTQPNAKTPYRAAMLVMQEMPSFFSGLV